MDDKNHDFEVLLESSSLGAPAAQLLRGRTSRSQARAIRRIGEVRENAAGGSSGRGESFVHMLLSGSSLSDRPGTPATASAAGEAVAGSGALLQDACAVRPNPVVRRIQLGSQLRQLRLARGITLGAASRSVSASETKMSRMELGRVGFKKRDVENLLTLYGITDEQTCTRVLTLAEEANRPGWWQRYSDIMPRWSSVYLGLESAASLIRAYEVQWVHPLLQTEDYARIVCRLCAPGGSKAEVERRVALRLERQQALLADDARELHVVMDESALRRAYGNRAVMRRQLQYLIELSERPNIGLQVMPFHSAAHPVTSGPFTLLSFTQPSLSDVVYVEQLTSALYLDRPEDVVQYANVHEGLQRDSPTPEGSRDLLRNLLTAA